MAINKITTNNITLLDLTYTGTGITPTGNINITSTTQVNVTEDTYGS